jgi:hypothetical protein
MKDFTIAKDVAMGKISSLNIRRQLAYYYLSFICQFISLLFVFRICGLALEKSLELRAFVLYIAGI